ncbi:MAG: hypothetical protein LC808_12145 [Actinobacteria bacterium]|nr:hypothetical protein [Actinomycetota bacterium]
MTRHLRRGDGTAPTDVVLGCHGQEHTCEHPDGCVSRSSLLSGQAGEHGQHAARSEWSQDLTGRRKMDAMRRVRERQQGRQLYCGHSDDHDDCATLSSAAAMGSAGRATVGLTRDIQPAGLLPEFL